MNKAQAEEDRELVLEHDQQGGNITWRAVSLDDAGALTIKGHDLGGGVEGFWGLSEYEFVRHFSVAETKRLRAALGADKSTDLLEAIGQHFKSTSELETFAGQHGLTGRFWSRVGD